MTYFYYSDRQPVLLGDRIHVALDRMATAEFILIPQSSEAKKWNIPEGGVMLNFDDGDRWLVSDFDEDFELISRKTQADEN